MGRVKSDSLGRGRVALRMLAATGIALVLGACSNTPKLASVNLADENRASPTAKPSTDLEKATDYWGREFRAKPQDPNAALNFAKNLKAGGNNAAAFAVLQQTNSLYPEHRQIASELGRLAIVMDKSVMAEKLLQSANDPAAPDWRVISGLGTVYAKRGEYDKAIGYFERAMELEPKRPSILNNLALAYTAKGDTKRAEALLRTASEQSGSAKVRQNLALVVGLQGRNAESQQIAAKSLAPEDAASNADFMRRMVKAPVEAPIQPPKPILAKASGRSKIKAEPAVAKAGDALKPSATMLAAERLADSYANR